MTSMHRDSIAMVGTSEQADMVLETKSSKQKCGICCIPIAARGVLDCCSDIFCFSCIDTWSAFTNLCPLCKLHFKFITFVPVADDEESSDVETQEAFFDFLGQERVESWIDDSEEDGTLSFPSYFIEEDAVVCLDGDGCHVRKGLTEEDGDSGLEDTSVACDSCDCWYHASCVGYKPDFQGERSWICPRCVGTGVLDLFKFQPPIKNITPKISSKTMSLDKDGSITFVDEGETAVVVSMDASFQSTVDHPADQAPSVGNTGLLGFLNENRLDDLCTKASVDTEETCVQASMGAAGISSKDTGIVGSDVSSLQPERTAAVEVFDQKCVEVDQAPSVGSTGLLGFLNENRLENLCAKAAVDTEETCVRASTGSAGISLKDTGIVASDVSSLVIPSTSPSSSPSTSDAAPISSTLISGAETFCQVSGEGVSDDSRPERNENIIDAEKALESTKVDYKREIGMSQGTKLLKQEVGSGIQYDKALLKKREPPHSPLEKHTREKKKLKSENRVLMPTDNLQSQSTSLGESLSDSISSRAAQARLPDKQPIKEELEPVFDGVMPDQCIDSKSDASMQEVFNSTPEVMDDLKELVQGLASCHRRVVPPRTNTNGGGNETSEGVRTRKIIYRGSVLDGKASKIVNEMRQHLKQEADGFCVTGDIRKVDVTDEKFFVAFKAAIQSSQANLRQQLVPSKKITLPKPGSKRDASRQSLMKKLYGGTGKRRQAWDRDWDISFWRERVSNEKRVRQSSKTLLQQEMAHIEEALRDSKEANKAELDSLRSRVYLADTSLLPRQTDIKPLSEQSSFKANPVTMHQSKSAGHAKTTERVSKQATTPEGSNAAAPDSNQPLKTDKRKWALEVLARKTGQPEKRPRNKGSLLAELPEHMRPVLEYERRSKVPTATRQVQLDRFIEHYLQRAPIEFVNDNPECQAAISAAVSKEKEIYDRANSKGVYVNLCVQALASSAKVAIPKVEEALLPEAAGPSPLLAAEVSPLEAVGTLENENTAVLMALKATGLISDSPPESPVLDGQETSFRNPPDKENSFDECNEQDGFLRSLPNMDNSSYTDIRHSLGILESSYSDVTEAGGDMSCGNGVENARGEETSIQGTASVEGTKQGKALTCDKHTHMEEVGEGVEPHAVTLQGVTSQEEFQQERQDCKQHEEGVQQEGADHEVHGVFIETSVQEGQSANSQSVTTEMRVDNALHTSESIERITKQVESYVKDHIRPLCRSHIITREQYMWAVAKTTNKVMQHHAKAKSADFLIPEGEKVRRLAEQYLQAYSEHMFIGGN